MSGSRGVGQTPTVLFRDPRPQASILTANSDVELGDGGKAGPPRVDFQVGEKMPRNLRGRWNYSRDGVAKTQLRKGKNRGGRRRGARCIR
jgi:hypothetical protein